MANRPEKLGAPKIDPSFKLDDIEKRITGFGKYVKETFEGNTAPEKAARNHAGFLLRDLIELKKEKDLPSRTSAVNQLFDNYNAWLKELPEESADTSKKDGSHPKSLTVTGMPKCPAGCDEKHFDALAKQVKSANSWYYTKATRSWTPDFGKQTGHEDGKGWKAYVDAAAGSGTKWRMGLTWKWDEDKDALAVKVGYCDKGH